MLSTINRKIKDDKRETRLQYCDNCPKKTGVYVGECFERYHRSHVILKFGKIENILKFFLIILTFLLFFLFFFLQKFFYPSQLPRLKTSHPERVNNFFIDDDNNEDEDEDR